MVAEIPGAGAGAVFAEVGVDLMAGLLGVVEVPGLLGLQAALHRDNSLTLTITRETATWFFHGNKLT